MKVPQSLETRRLRFRLLNMGDLGVIARQVSDPEMCRYLSDPPCTVDEAQAIIEHYRQPDGQDHLRYGLFSKETGAFIGTCGYHYLDFDRRQVEIGYDIWREHWQQGYASEALPELIAVCFGYPAIQSVYVLVHPDNQASIATARRLGFLAADACRPGAQGQECLKLTRERWITMQQQDEGQGKQADTDTRHRKRVTFNSAADLYQRARPEYPAEVFDELIKVAGLLPGDHLLEIGCATGKATLPLAERGFRITCVELGAELAAAAREALAAFPAVTVHNDTFENWHAPEGASFDLIFAATAWAWLDPEVKYRRAWQLLRPGGHLAFWDATHVVPENGDPFFTEIQPVYEEIGHGLPPGATQPTLATLKDKQAEIEASGLFDQVFLRRFRWEVSYDAEGYIDLLRTFSDHIALADWQRERLFGEIRRRLAERPSGRLRRGWGAVLHVATRKG